MSQLAIDTNSINLGQGFPDTDGPSEIAEAAIGAIRSGHNQYPPGSGIRELRQAIAYHQKLFYGLDLDPDTDVLVTAGATEALAASVLALCEVGDEVIVFEPYYDAYVAVIAMAGAVSVPVRLNPGDWSFNLEDLRAAIGPRTRAILVNSPHNPTGKVFSRDELGAIAKLCVASDIIAITDEVYEHMVFSGEHLPLGSLPGMQDRTIAISSAAKTFSFTGWKIGWAVSSKELIAAVRTAKQFLTYVNGAPFQVAIAYALGQGRRFCDLVVPSLTRQRETLSKGLSEIGFDVLSGDGTYFLTTDISPLSSLTAMEFCLSLPKRAQVVAVPSSAFYSDPSRGDKLVRWTFCKKIDVIEEAVDRLSKLAKQ